MVHFVEYGELRDCSARRHGHTTRAAYDQPQSHCRRCQIGTVHWSKTHPKLVCVSKCRCLLSQVVQRGTPRRRFYSTSTLECLQNHRTTRIYVTYASSPHAWWTRCLLLLACVLLQSHVVGRRARMGNPSMSGHQGSRRSSSGRHGSSQGNSSRVIRYMPLSKREQERENYRQKSSIYQRGSRVMVVHSYPRQKGRR